MLLQTVNFRSLGAGIRTTGVEGSGPLIRGCMHEAAKMLPRIHGAQGVFDRRLEVISTHILPTGLHTVALADIANGDLARLDTSALKGLVGAHKTVPSQGGGYRLLLRRTQRPAHHGL